MAFVWDYNEAELKKSPAGRLKILERMINYGPRKGEKISLSAVKRNWGKLDLFPRKKKLFRILIWGK